MSKRIAGSLGLLAAIFVFTAGAAADATEDKITIGHFIEQLAALEGFKPADAEAAVRSLRKAGHSLPADLKLSAPLTQRDAIALSAGLGVPVDTDDPDALVDRSRLDSLMAIFASAQLLGAQGTCAQPESPEDCLTKCQGLRACIRCCSTPNIACNDRDCANRFVKNVFRSPSSP